ncbi:hypothetical protein TNCV_1515371 [Trichonephila clavipes]|nr:hypothetical protein TNCV_1515371 [Trichonephila clavipes]
MLVHITARLSPTQCLQGYDVPTMACQVTRSFANKSMSGRAGEGNCSPRDTGELTAQMPSYGGIFHGGHK